MPAFTIYDHFNPDHLGWLHHRVRRKVAVSRSGDIWQMGPHRLICGDARDLAIYQALLGDERAQMVFTDPPYNVPINGHVCGLGEVKHREFAMAAGEMSYWQEGVAGGQQMFVRRYRNDV